MLFQFVLWEFFSTCSEITAVKNAFAFFTPSEGYPGNARMLASTFISTIDKHRTNLTHLSIKHTPLVNTLYCTEGALDKLRRYFQAFQAIKKENKKNTTVINKHIARCFLNVLELEEILPANNSTTSLAEQKISAKTLKIAKVILGKIELSASKMRNQLFVLIQSYGKDEHVLSFLLRHQGLFAESFGKGLLIKHVKSVFPEGMHELKNHLHLTFTQKGFKHALPSINNFIDTLEKENAEL